MDRDLKKYLQWLGIAALIIVLANMLGGCVRIGAQPKLEPKPSVIISPVVQNNLDFLFFAIADRANLEAWFCLVGFNDTVSKNVLVQSITPVWVDSADASNITGRPTGCGTSTIGTIHFHPGVGFCAFSNIDINTAHFLPYPTTAIVCRDKDKDPIRVMLLNRSEIDSTWDVLPKCEGCGVRQYTPVYRYVRPP